MDILSSLLSTLHKKWSFPLRISSINVTKYAGNCWFGHIYWRNLQLETSFFVAIKPLRFHWQKIIWDFSFSGPGFCSPLSINNSLIKCLVKAFSQAKWVPIRGTFIHFVMTDHEISTFIFNSTQIKKNKIKKNFILICCAYKQCFEWWDLSYFFENHLTVLIF